MTTERLYGLHDDDHLEESAGDVLENVLESACQVPGEPFDAIASRIASGIGWPIKIKVFKRMELGGESAAKHLAEDILATALNILDENYGDPDGDPADPSENMKSAALALGRAIVADYKPWACEATGEVLEFTQEQVAATEKEKGRK
ncbi:MAG: hypothetical protein V2A73_01930 [Pseudomonadota bacterium]